MLKSKTIKMSNKNKLESLVVKNGYRIANYEIIRSVFGTFYSGSLVNKDNKVEYDFKGTGIDEACNDILDFLNNKS